MLPPLPSRDIESLLGGWPYALTCSTWRLRGESPSPGLFEEIRSGADHEIVLRGHADRAVGLLQAREVDPASGCAYLGFMLPSADGAAAIVERFLTNALEQLELRRIIVLVDEDMLGVVQDDSLPLDPAGRRRQHARVGTERYVDQHVFDFTGKAAQS